MMVQNCDRLLPIALESLGEIYDELILVDGGSTDATCEIARQYGATLIHSPWPNHHAQQRNIYLDAVKTDWVFAIDSDEFIDTNTLHFLQQLKLQGEQFISEVFFLPRRWISPHSLSHYISSAPHFPDGQARIFRPAGLRYEGQIHSRPVGVPKPCQIMENLALYHLDLFVNSIAQQQAKVAKYSTENSQDGAAEFYTPDESSLQIVPWSSASLLPAVADRLRQLDPNLPHAKRLFSKFTAAPSSNETALIIFPDWKNLTATSFEELVTVLQAIALESEPIALYVTVNEESDRFITAVLTNLLSELRITHGLEVPESIEIICISAAMQAEIASLQPIKLTLEYEDAEAAAFAADRLAAWPIA